MSTALRPEHATRDYGIPHADDRLTLRRTLAGYAYAAHGNLHNPTPEYRWLLIADGHRIVDSAPTKREMVAAARNYGRDYLAEVDDK